MKKNIFILPLFLVINLVYAQSSAESLVNNFFSTYINNKEKAVRELYATNAWTETNKEIINNIVKVVNDLTISTVGSYYGYEIVSTKSTSESFSTIYVVVKYDRQPIRFIFTLYKPKDKWRLQAFSLDDNIEDKTEDKKK